MAHLGGEVCAKQRIAPCPWHQLDPFAGVPVQKRTEAGRHHPSELPIIECVQPPVKRWIRVARGGALEELTDKEIPYTHVQVSSAR